MADTSTSNEGDTPETATTNTNKLSCLQCRAKKLKCDRVLPRCGRCTKLADGCAYPGNRQRLVGRKRNVKELEARLVQLEERIKDNKTMGKDMPPYPSGSIAPQPDWNQSIEDTNHNAFQDDSLNNQFVPQQEEFAPNPLIGLGLFEQLPPWAVIEDLTDIYFSKFHHRAPMLHRTRYITSIHLRTHLSPPMSLQYTVMAMAAKMSDKYSNLAMPFYQRAKNYLDMDEVRDNGEHFFTVASAQCCILLSYFEGSHLWFPRASVTIARCVRLVQMLSLHYLDPTDHLGHAPQPTIPPARDWTELEERRRTFWMTFCADRLISSTTGWPLLINYRDVGEFIHTLLPASEEAFQSGFEEKTCSLTEALKPNASSYSPFAGKILASHLFQTNLEHSFNSQPDDNPEDIKNGAYWKRHRDMDNSLSTMSMLLPESLKLPRAFRDQNAVFVNLTIYASTISLHRAALAKVKQHNLPEVLLTRSKARLFPAAEEIMSILKMSGNFIYASQDALIGFVAFMAASVFIDDFIEMKNQQSEDNLEFLLTIMAAASNGNAIIRSLTVQLALQMKRSGVDPSAIDKVKISFCIYLLAY
ncbi:hypothetical protein F5884DRAFT_686650 [Xylogone sp. PMI_703]|nr:hypothetical protein F5884DRAFT_686650 [Xylogone sp. PMI_703]